MTPLHVIEMNLSLIVAIYVLAWVRKGKPAGWVEAFISVYSVLVVLIDILMIIWSRT